MAAGDGMLGPNGQILLFLLSCSCYFLYCSAGIGSFQAFLCKSCVFFLLQTTFVVS